MQNKGPKRLQQETIPISECCIEIWWKRCSMSNVLDVNARRTREVAMHSSLAGPAEGLSPKCIQEVAKCTYLGMARPVITHHRNMHPSH
jgi:hypothetical protein